MPNGTASPRPSSGRKGSNASPTVSKINTSTLSPKPSSTKVTPRSAAKRASQSALKDHQPTLASLGLPAGKDLPDEFLNLQEKCKLQASDLAYYQQKCEALEAKCAALEQQIATGVVPSDSEVQQQLKAMEKQSESQLADLRTAEARIMALEKAQKTRQIEEVSMDEMDELFFTLEQKEQALAQVSKENNQLKEEILTARSRAAAQAEAKPMVIEVHYDALSDSEDDEDRKK